MSSRICRSGLLVLAASAAAAAQVIEGLATNYDGSGIYFSTSLRQRGSNQSNGSKVFLLRGRELEFIEDTGAIVHRATSLNDTGTARALNRRSICQSPSYCLFRELLSTKIETGERSFSFAGNASISRNGLFGVVYGNTSHTADLPSGSVRRIDIRTGEVTLLGRQVASTGHFVANDGAVLVAGDGGRPRLGGPAGTINLQPTPIMSHAVLAANAASVL
ncbi:MAG: hypothetical protein FJW31_25790 [Acidobacteria bacterium]|nr:hypothetical protein [Acidobacteriota bacterium]